MILLKRFVVFEGNTCQY